MTIQQFYMCNSAMWVFNLDYSITKRLGFFSNSFMYSVMYVNKPSGKRFARYASAISNRQNRRIITRFSKSERQLPLRARAAPTPHYFDVVALPIPTL